MKKPPLSTREDEHKQRVCEAARQMDFARGCLDAMGNAADAADPPMDRAGVLLMLWIELTAGLTALRKCSPRELCEEYPMVIAQRSEFLADFLATEAAKRK